MNIQILFELFYVNSLYTFNVQSNNPFGNKNKITFLNKTEDTVESL